MTDATGILAEYGLDLDDVEVPSFEIADGTYPFVIGDVFVREGSQSQPNKSWLIIEYLLGDEGKKHGELFGLPEDASAPTDKEKAALGRYKGRLLALGIPENQINNVGRDELIGIRGEFTLLTKGAYQNIRNFKVEDDGANAFAQEAEAPEAAAPAPAARRSAPAQKAPSATQPPTVKANPFAK